MFRAYKINNLVPISNAPCATKTIRMVDRIVESVENPENFAKFVENKQSKTID